MGGSIFVMSSKVSTIFPEFLTNVALLAIFFHDTLDFSITSLGSELDFVLGS